MKDEIVWIYLTVLAVKPYSMISFETSDGAAARLPFRFQIRNGFMSLGAEIKKLRIKKGESLQDVANAVKASKAHIWDIERGASKNPTMDLLGRVAAHFGVSIASLVGEDPPKGMQSELVALYRDLKDLSDSDRDTIRALAKRLSEKKKE